MEYQASETLVLIAKRNHPARRNRVLTERKANVWWDAGALRSCDHGERILSRPIGQPVDLAPGNYIIETAQAVDEENPFVVSLCRLRRV